MIKIEWYEGARAEENPRWIVIDSERLFVDEILDRARLFDKTTQGYGQRIRIRCGKKVFRLTEDSGKWNAIEE